jgi:hypothetical protein
MKALNLQNIDSFEIVTHVSRLAIDPEKTNAKIKLLLSENPELKKIKTEAELYSENAVPVYGVANQKIVEDSTGTDFEIKLDGLGKYKKLLLSGEEIADLRNVEFCIKGQKWEKQKIERPRDTIPENGVLEENLSDPQRAEIAADKEIERISRLTPEQKDEEKTGLLNSAKREATLLKSDAGIAGEQFDAAGWFQAKKSEIETKYGS